MNARNHFLFLALTSSLVMSATGCVCVVTPSSGGNATFTWTFNGQACALVPDVAQVHIDIPGQTLASNGTYSCVNSGTAGIVLLDFAPGTYNFTIEGRNTGGTALYRATGSFRVNGDISVPVDLAPVSGAPGSALVTWTFPAGATCANAISGGLTKVGISVDGQTPTSVACTAGFGTTGVQIQSISAGTHNIVLEAMDNSNFVYFRKTSTLTINAGAQVSSAYTFEWYVGGLSLKWTLTNLSSVVQTCAQAGVTTVNINLEDSAGAQVYGALGVDVACNTAGNQGTVFDYLYPDTYKVFLQASGSGSVLFKSNWTTPPSFVVASGVGAVLDVNTPTLSMQAQ